MRNRVKSVREATLVITAQEEWEGIGAMVSKLREKLKELGFDKKTQDKLVIVGVDGRKESLDLAFSKQEKPEARTFGFTFEEINPEEEEGSPFMYTEASDQGAIVVYDRELIGIDEYETALKGYTIYKGTEHRALRDGVVAILHIQHEG